MGFSDEIDKVIKWARERPLNDPKRIPEILEIGNKLNEENFYVFTILMLILEIQVQKNLSVIEREQVTFDIIIENFNKKLVERREDLGSLWEESISLELLTWIFNQIFQYSSSFNPISIVKHRYFPLFFESLFEFAEVHPSFERMFVTWGDSEEFPIVKVMIYSALSVVQNLYADNRNSRIFLELAEKNIMRMSKIERNKGNLFFAKCLARLRLDTKVLSICEKDIPIGMKVEILAYLGFINAIDGYGKKSNKYYDLAISETDKFDDVSERIERKAMIATLIIKGGNLLKGKELIDKISPVFYMIEQNQNNTILSYSFSHALSLIGRFDEAEEVAWMSHCGITISDGLQVISEELVTKGYTDKAIRIINKNPIVSYRLSIKSSIALEYLKKDQLDEAIEIIKNMIVPDEPIDLEEFSSSKIN